MDAGGLGSEVAFALREIVVSSVLEAMVAEALSATVRSASCLLMMVYNGSHPHLFFVAKF